MQPLRHFVLLAFIVGIRTSLSYHVLFYHNWGTKSHLIQFAPVMEELLGRGHEVTAVIYNSIKVKNENYTEILVPNAGDRVTNEVSQVLMSQNRWNFTMWMSLYEQGKQSLEDIAVQPLRDDKFKAFLKSEKKVDLIVAVMGTGAFLADHFNCPIALFSPIGPMGLNVPGTGIDINLSVQPSVTGGLIEPMTFFERIGNHIKFRGEMWFLEWLLNLLAGYQREEWNSGPIRDPLVIMRERFSILISASHPVTHGSWPYPPNIIECGSLHLKDPQPLPSDLKNFMDSSKRGVVFVSFGSAIKPSQMPKERMLVFLEAFRNIDLSVIWKWDSEIPNLPQNVMISPWVPQQDLLAHPKLKVFVTHGGMGSIMESIYHKATIVGIPLANDQRANLLRAANHGYARMLDWASLTAEDLSDAINEGAKDDEMTSAVERIHDLYVDSMQRPVELAAWWLEYVCRHEGAGILQHSAGDGVPWYQWHHVDIAIFIIGIASFICGTIVLSCVICFKKCFKKKIKTE